MTKVPAIVVLAFVLALGAGTVIGLLAAPARELPTTSVRGPGAAEEDEGDLGGEQGRDAGGFPPARGAAEGAADRVRRPADAGTDGRVPQAPAGVRRATGEAGAGQGGGHPAGRCRHPEVAQG